MTPKTARFPDHPMPVEDILGYPVTAAAQAQIKAQVAQWLDAGGPPKIFACANPHSLHVARRDPAFHTALKTADLLTPDGIGIILASRVLGGTIRDRISGYDVFEDTSALLEARGGRVFFLGSSDMVLVKVRDRLAVDYPGLTLAGTYSPPFKLEFTAQDNADMVAAVRAARPDVLWVGMTAPKQEKWIAAHAADLGVPFIGAIGAVFDFYAGTVPRSPALFRKLGLEWLPRLLRQPKRLWRRNFVSNPAFMLRVLWHRAQHMVGGAPSH